MVLTRRMVVGGALSGSAMLFCRRAIAQPSPISQGSPIDVGLWPNLVESLDELPLIAALPSGLGAGISARVGNMSLNFGAVQPPPFYRSIATAVMQNAPINCRPIDVAYYFDNLRKKNISANLLNILNGICSTYQQTSNANVDFFSTFCYDWERNQYFNPVVVGFFRGVGLVASQGDNTAWCAAFANWCIARSRSTSASAVSFGNSLIGLGTRSASSGSFRCWQQDSSSAPAEGDIVVFASSGTVGQKCGLATGHVGFLSRLETLPNGKIVLHVIGGNQGASSSAAAAESGGGTVGTTSEAVSIRRFGKVAGKLHLHAIRTASFLR